MKKVVITTDGHETLARLFDGKVIRSASAKCSPPDTFNFATGARLAFDRLMQDKPEPTPDYSKWVAVKREPKVGDKVRIINAKPLRSQNYANGDVLTLYSAYQNGGAGANNEQGLRVGGLIACEYEILEPPFNVGDRVRIKVSGTIGKVEHVQKSGDVAVALEYGACWLFDADMLEPAPKMVRVFSKEKFDAREGNDARRSWPLECDMREVRNGEILGTPYGSRPNWETEVTESEVRK